MRDILFLSETALEDLHDKVVQAHKNMDGTKPSVIFQLQLDR